MVRVRCHRAGLIWCCLAAVGMCGGRAAAQQSPASSPTELFRKWDIDKNGAIDDGEAEVARAKMRRERVEAQAQAGLDPLTGRPRAVAIETPEGTDERSPRDLPEVEKPRPKPERSPLLPSTRKPQLRPALPSASPASRRPDAAAGPDGGGTGRQPRAAGEAGPRGPGGAMPFRGLTAGRPGAGAGLSGGGAGLPGYGAGEPKPDLNAARPPTLLPGRRQPPASGGLLPSLRTRPAAAAPPAIVPRRTIDDYDVY